MKKIIFLLTVAVSAFMIACNDASESETSTMSTEDSSTFDLSKARTAIEADNAKFMEELKKGDSAALAEHYHSEGQLLMANSEPVMRKDISSAWGSVIRMGVKDFKLTTTDVVGNDDLLVETGLYEMYGDKNSVIDKGKYVVAWRKENGNWKLYRDIGNSSIPMQNKK
jgi:ketosteroid isomerase-like protein